MLSTTRARSALTRKSRFIRAWAARTTPPALVAGPRRASSHALIDVVAKLFAMSPEPRTDIIQALESSKQEFHSAASGLADVAAKTRPEPDRWSVLECIEHVAVVEERFLKRLEHIESAPPPDKEREASLAARAADRSN